MDIDEYRIDFLNQIRNDASLAENDVDNQFIGVALEQLEELGELMDSYPYSFEMRGSRNRLLAFDAYAYDEADSSIVLLISDFQNTIEKTTLTKTRIEELYKRMRYFIEEAYDGNIKKFCDDSDPIIEIANEFKKKLGSNTNNSEILKFKFFIITNSVLSSQVKSLKEESLLGRPINLYLWPLERFYNVKMSKTNESIKINCNDYGIDGIQCLKANLGMDNSYDSYMAIVPGKFLAGIYLDHGSRLLEGNVRAFLSVRGKVNRKIRETIIGKNPENFFTYNNGIAVIAHSIELSEDKTRIMSFYDFQIINGGQTTASLASAVIKKEICSENLDKIFVPMKLTVLNIEGDLTEEEEDKYNDVTQKISKSANCQNPVNDADFFSNDPFHRQMEQLSQKYFAPPVNGKPYQTIWYYERSKGRWEQEQMKMTATEKKKYQKVRPKNQVIKKEKLAKCLNTIYMKPDLVCGGSANNMKSFAVTINQLCEKSKDNINEFFFIKSVASVILFDTTDRIVNKSDWYVTGGNKAQIVPYTIAKIIASLPKGKDLDWKKIWQKQMLYPELVHQIEIVAKIANDFLINKSEGVIVREFARKQQNWELFRNDDEYIIELTEDFLRTLVNIDYLKSEEQSAKREHRFNSEIDLEVEFYRKGFNYWMNFANELESERISSIGNCDFIRTIASYIYKGKLPSKLQIRKLLKIIKDVENNGYIMPE